MIISKARRLKIFSSSLALAFLIFLKELLAIFIPKNYRRSVYF